MALRISSGVLLAFRSVHRRPEGLEQTRHFGEGANVVSGVLVTAGLVFWPADAASVFVGLWAAGADCSVAIQTGGQGTDGGVCMMDWSLIGVTPIRGLVPAGAKRPVCRLTVIGSGGALVGATSGGGGY